MRKSQTSRETWEQIKHEYITEPGATLRFLSERHRVSYRALAQRCARDGWNHVGRIQAVREEQETPGLNLVLPTRPEDIADFVAGRALESGLRWLDRIERVWKSEMRTSGTKAIQSLIPAWKTVIETMRKSGEAATQQDKQPQNLVRIAFLSPGESAEKTG